MSPINDNKDSSQEITILLNEYNQANERIESFINRQDSIIQITLALIGGSIAFFVYNQQPISPLFFLIIPFLPVLLFTHIAYNYTRSIANQSYRAYLQKAINQKLEASNRLHYSQISYQFLLKSNPAVVINQLMFPTIIGATLIISIFLSNFDTLVIIGNIIIAISVLIAAIRLRDFINILGKNVTDYCNTNSAYTNNKIEIVNSD